MNIYKICEDFFIFSCMVYGKFLVYLDNGVIIQKFCLVIDLIVDEYYLVNVNVYWGVYFLFQQVMELYEVLCEIVCQFINVCSICEVIFICGIMESINLIVFSFGEEFM